MNELFLKIINMSISASWLVLAVLLLRFVLKNVPRWVNVLLWGIVAVRLTFPFSIESALSLIPSAETVPMDIEMAARPAIDSGIPVINSMVNPVLSSLAPSQDVLTSANPLQIWIPILCIVWVIGVAAFLLYTVVSYWSLRRKVREAVFLRNNICQSENVVSPFVMGIIKPKIYLPFKMDLQNLEHVVAHEQAHIRRKDHWWKPLGFLLLTIHWFNPLMWLAYVLLCRDIELACDEKVIRDLGNEQRADYTQALVTCSVNRRMIAACPLAFGEVGVKERVKSVMNYKKPAFWVIVLAIIICLIVAICFLTNPKTDDAPDSVFKNDEKVWLEPLQGIAGQTYVYEGEGIMGSFTITLYDDGTFTYNEGMASSYIGIGSWEQNGDSITLTDNADGGYGLVNHFRCDGNDLVFVEQDSDNFIYVKIDNGSRFNQTAEAFKPNNSEVDSLDAAISSAILEHYTSEKPDGLIHVESHVLLENEAMSGAPLFGANDHVEKVTAFLLVYHVKYSTYGRKLEAVGGSYVPTAITFKITDSGEYVLEEYWEPRDGSYYEKDIRDKFPGVSADDALNDQAYIEYLKEQTYNKALAYLNSNISLDVRIEDLLNEIQTSPAHSSNPGDYIREHETEYEELLSYGEKTIKFCFAEFLQGEQIDLRGHIMAMACQDIVDAFGEKKESLDNIVRTGQDWFDGFYSYAQVLAKNHSAEYLEKHYPATFLLIQMSNGEFVTKK